MAITKQIGQYVKRKDVEIITYIEKTEDLGEIDNFITIQPHKVNIKRSGSIGMNQQFIEGKITECLYRHPYGSFYLKIDTISITHRSLQKAQSGEVVIEYVASINGEEQRSHHLTLSYMEEK